MIDAHQHFWAPARGDYGWLTPGSPLHRDYRPDDLAPLLRATGVEATILVQAAPTKAETDYLLDLARQEDRIAGVVGWIDFGTADAPDRIAARATDPLLVGLRPMLQDIAEDDWILGPRQMAALAATAAHGLAFDALVRPGQIDVVTRIAEQLPALRIVLDHAGKPPFGDPRAMRRWDASIATLATYPNVACKLSGLATELPDPQDTAPLPTCIARLSALFGPDRLVWGSDWPVATLAIGYRDWLDLCVDACVDLTAAGREAVFGGNARRLYRLPPATAF